ncbi:MAG: biopolymer transporter ExbD [Planctomycetes bacterium]|nr:biopolymer transporter ExbD [Planctomycetota bacterium]
MSELSRIATEESKLEMTPMIDVTFLLLIFFMCTLKFKTLEGKLAAYLPKDVGVNTSQAEPIEKVEITVRVIREGTKMKPVKDGQTPTERWDPDLDAKRRYVFGSDRVLEYAIGPRKTQSLSELADRLKQLHGVNKERPATIDARKGVVYEDVIQVLDSAMNADFKEVTFVGSYE